MTADAADEGAAPHQPLFRFPAPPARWSDLLHGPHNAAAIRIAGQSDAWPTPVLCLTGPPASGLSFIAEAWAHRNAGTLYNTATLVDAASHGLPGLANGHIAIDDAHDVAAEAPEVLLTLVNLAPASGARILLTAHRPPAQWRTSSADLRSRLNALHTSEIGPPDEAVLRARLGIAAGRRFLRLSPETINYLVPRLELSYEALETFMDRLSRAVSDHDRAPSLPLARQVLLAGSGAGNDDDAEG